MSSRNCNGLIAPGALVIALGIVTYGCSSGGGAADGGAPSDDGSSSDSPPPIRGGSHPDAAFVSDTGSGGAESSVGTSDGTTGAQCTMDADCGISNVCSTSLPSQGLVGSLYPTPVCLNRNPCDLLDGTRVTFCDGTAPTNINSPGICLALTPGMMTGPNGTCFPLCVVLNDGTKQQGCAGKDVCHVISFVQTTGGSPAGLGYCYGGCAADADCPNGEKCQTDEGICVKAVQPPSKPLGAACTSSGTTVGAVSTHVCSCLTNNAGTAGVCSQFCVAGANSPAPCPSGYVCDSLLPSELATTDGGALPGFVTQNPGLGGFCLQACSGASDAGAASADAGVDAGPDATADGSTGSSTEGGAAGSPDAGGGGAAGTCSMPTICTLGDTAGPVCLP